MFPPSPSFKEGIVNLFIIGIGGFATLKVLYWLFVWLAVSISYCSLGRHHSFDAYRHVCGLPLYPKWEYLSWRYGDEFRRSIQTVKENGCIADDVAVDLKVMHYQQEQVLVWYRGESGNKYLVQFQPHLETNDWTLFDQEQQICQIDIIYSATGGSADDIFWY